MRAILTGAVVGAAILAGCAPGPGAPGATRNCDALFRKFEVAVRTARTYGGQDDMAVRSAVGWRAQDLRRAGCITSTADRAGLEAHAFRVRGVGNAAIGRRIHRNPFATEGGIAGADAIARRAGFTAPYPRVI